MLCMASVMHRKQGRLRASSSFLAAGAWPSNTYTGLMPASSMRAVLKNMPCKWLREATQHDLLMTTSCAQMARSRACWSNYQL